MSHARCHDREVAMISLADERWPIVAITRSGAFTMADATALVITCDNVLRRREPFALTLIYDEPASTDERDAGADAFAARWLQANDTLWREWCRGCATTGASPDPMEPLLASLAEIGCPVTFCAEQDSGEAWLLEQVEESNSRAVEE
jgi:hypothetical protein